MGICTFGDIVVVDSNNIGVVVKCWKSMITGKRHYEVYVRNYNDIKEYDEEDIQRYIYNKDLLNEELSTYDS